MFLPKVDALRRAEKKGINNAQSLFGLHQIPTNNQIRDLQGRFGTTLGVPSVLGNFQRVGANGSLIRASLRVSIIC